VSTPELYDSAPAPPGEDAGPPSADRAPAGETRTYRGRSIEELIPRIQAELGADAIVVRRREGLTGGFAGFFQRRFVELEALRGGPRIDVYDDGAAPALPPALERPAPAPAPAPERPAQPEPAVAFAAALAEAEAATAPAPAAAPARIPPPPARIPPPPARSLDTREGVEHSLLGFGISEELAGELIESAIAHVLSLAPEAGLASAVRMTLAQRMPVAPPLPARGAAIALVGPDDSGRTGCCLALMHAYRRSPALWASCATIVPGTTPLQEPRMLLSPHLMTPTPLTSTRAASALAQARGEGVAILDTPSVSPAQRAEIRRLAGALAALEPTRVVVALPATLGAWAASQLLAALRPLGASAVAITHAEETVRLGAAVEAACRFGLAPEYLFDRGRSHGALTRIDPTYLAQRLLP